MKNEEQDAMIRRYFLGALIELKEGREAQKALIKSLEDSDAEIRVQAANAMKNMIGVEESVKLLVPLVFEPERKDASYLLDAMRLIDKGKAANLLREEMNSPNARTSRRASELLIDLGGEAAAQILLNERTKALDRYTRILTSADYEVRQHFNQLMSQATSAFWISMAMHTVIFLFGVAALTGSLMLAFNGGEKSIATWAAGGVGVAGVLLTTFYKNPLQNMRASLNALMQVNVVFLGYVRQINQIDATFKHLFLEPQGFGTTQMKEIVVEIQNTVIRALEEIKKYIMEKPDIQKQEMKKQKAEESQSAA
jgi:hypothetical protein